MVEELYVIRNNKRYRLDLSMPSGITLNFKSNIFSDLSKITASYSYTFKLPMTANNRRVLDSAEDVRGDSAVTHLKLKGEYVQNGIPLFENVNLYIDSIDTAYNCVMTWGDAMAFGRIKDDNLKLNELTAFNGVAEWSSMEGKINSFDNASKVLTNVVYNAGVTAYNFLYDSRIGKRRVEITSVPFVPVVPVYAILNAITAKYGISFPFATRLTGATWIDDEDRFDCVNKGVIPFVDHQLSQKQYSEYLTTLSSPAFSTDGPHTIEGREFKNEITFKKFVVGKDTGFGGNGYVYINTTVYGGSIARGFQLGWGVKAKLTGCFRLKFSDLSSGQTPVMKLCYSEFKSIGSDGHSEYEWTDISEVAGKIVQGTTDTWEFDFRDATSSTPLEYENPYGTSVGVRFWFSHTVTSFSMIEIFKILPIEVIDEGTFSGKCNPMECMPETTVLDFLKSLFFMTGTFPVFKNNTLHAISYDVFKDNIDSGNVYDWSSKLTTTTSQLPTKTSFIVSDYANRNTYGMSTDNTEGDSSTDSKDVYQKGLASFYLSSGLITTKEKTIAKLPWAAPYLLNREFPNEKTGDTIKCWVLNKDSDNSFWAPKVKYNAPKPALGIIIQKEISHIDGNGNVVNDGKVMSMRIWNDLSKVLYSSSMTYLRSILNKPIIITENVELNEFDLRDLEFSVPVYLTKHNAYFAIVSITRDSKDICKCELIKLP